MLFTFFSLILFMCLAYKLIQDKDINEATVVTQIQLFFRSL